MTGAQGRRHLMGDELAPTALLDTFEMGDLHAMSPVVRHPCHAEPCQ